MNSKPLYEGLAKLSVDEGIFFNERMRQCRDLSSLWVGTLPKIELAIDAFCASGVRGIRYLLENENVKKVHFIERSSRAAKNAAKNLKLNEIKKTKYEILQMDVNRYFYDNPLFSCKKKKKADAFGDMEDSGEKRGGIDTFDFAEIDPFGTPAPFLDSLLSCRGSEREKYISVTATDMAVLCGAHRKACIKNYSVHPIDNEFCHEAALRILLGKIASVGAMYNWALEPKFCFSHFHYVKIFAKIKQGADGALESAKLAQGYAQYCPSCMYHNLSLEFPQKICPSCGKRLQWAGPMWAGKWCEKKTIEEMQKLLAKRKYMQAQEIAKFLQMAHEEADGPPFYYNVHKIAKKYCTHLPKSEELVNALKKEGYFASRTHFKQTAVRTDAPMKIIVKNMGKKG